MTKIALAVVMLSAAGCAQIGRQPQAVPPDAAPTLEIASAAETNAPAAPLPAVAHATVSPLSSTTAEVEVAMDETQSLELDSPASIWPRLRHGFAIPAMDDDLVRHWEQWYSARPDYVARMIDRSSHFLFYIVEQVEKRNMPLEIALLPMIESAYNPAAYSKAHASGMWQFIPSTGKDYGLRQNYWYDGRRDVIEATEAALDYLEKLYGMFGDWRLALASYNWGEGAVRRAIERNRAKGLRTDYLSLTLPAETRSYVPKLVAMKNIISDPARFGLDIEDIPNEPYFDIVEVAHHIDVKLAAELAEIPLDEFRFLNSGHKKPVIKAGEAEQIVLPKDKVTTFRANLKTHDKPFLSWKTIRLRRGDKARRLAAIHGMTLAELKRVNGVGGHKRLVPGQPLLVRVRSGVEDSELRDIAATPVSLPRALRAAKAKSTLHKGRHVHVGADRTGSNVRRSGHENVVRKHGKRRAKQLRTSRSTLGGAVRSAAQGGRERKR